MRGAETRPADLTRKSRRISQHSRCLCKQMSGVRSVLAFAAPALIYSAKRWWWDWKYFIDTFIRKFNLGAGGNCSGNKSTCDVFLVRLSTQTLVLMNYKRFEEDNTLPCYCTCLHWGVGCQNHANTWSYSRMTNWTREWTLSIWTSKIRAGCSSWGEEDLLTSAKCSC